MAANTKGGTTTSFSNTPQAKEDVLGTTSSGALITEDSTSVILDVLSNDLGGNAKSLWSLDDGTSASTATKNYAPADLLTQDTARSAATSTDLSAYGARIWITADGKVGYDTSTFNSAVNAAVQALAVGESFTDSFTYAIRLGDGTLSWATSYVVLTGSNDGVTITSQAQTGAVTEDAADTSSTTDSLSASGTVSFNDVDLSDTHTASFVTATGNTTSLGTFVLASVNEAANAANGSVNWTYDLNNAAAQHLAQGQVVTETFIVTIDDGHGATVTQNVVITITGTNDGPVVASDDITGEVTELVTPSGNLSDSGTIAFTDVDLTDTHSISAVTPSAGALGVLTASVTADTTGSGLGGVVSWSYNVAASAVEYLAAGQTKLETFSFDVLDGQGGSVARTVSVTVTGTNDGPVITNTAAALAGAVTEDAALTATGQLSASDVDNGATQAWSVQGAAVGTYGAMAVDSNGQWTYTLDNAAHQNLALGESHNESFVVRVTDDQGAFEDQTVTVTITGTNDAPVIAGGPQAGAVQEDVVTQTAGQLVASDVDNDAVLAWTLSGGTGGEANYTFDGVDYTFTVDQLNIARNGLDYFSDAYADGNPGVGGLFGGVIPGSYFTSGVFQEAGGRLIMDDSGAGPTFAHLFTSIPYLGHFATVATDISNNMSTGLKSDDDFTVAARFDLTAPDENGEAYGIRLSDFIPSGPSAHPGDDVMELVVRRGDDGLVRVQFLERDFAAGSATSYAAAVLNAPAGADQIVLKLSHQAANVGEVTASFDYLSGGAVVGSHTFGVTGQIFGTETPGDTSDDEMWTRAQIITYSPGEVVGTSIAGVYGTLAIQQNGQWLYDLDNDSALVQALAEGQTATETFTATVLDEHGASDSQTISVTVTGTNDAPVIAAQDLAGAVTAVAADPANPPSPLVFNVQQFLGFQSNNLATLQSYAASHAANYTVQTNVIDYTDDPGGFAGELPGSTRWPAAEAQNVNGTAESINNTFFARITANFSVATADTYTFRTYNDDGVFLLIDNTLVISDTGYHPEAPFTGSIALAPGNHSIELFFYENGGEASLEFSARNSTGSFGLVGASGGGLGGAVGQLTDSGVISFSDVDLTDVHLVSASGTPVGAALGTLTAVKNSDTTGTGAGGQLTWTYKVANSAVAYLAAGETRVESFTITLNDQHGGLIFRQIDVTVTGTNDAPVVAVVDVSGAVTEQLTPAGNLIDSGTIAFTDVDLSDVHLVSATAVGATLGSLNAAKAGDTTGTGTGGQVSWTYTVADAAVEILGTGQVKHELFNVTVDDQHGGVVTRQVDVAITGTNDGPVANADANSTDVVVESGVNPGNTPFGGDSSASGNVLLNDTDVDQGDTKAVVGVQAGVAGGPLGAGAGATITGIYGSVVIGANGAYTYTLDNADPQTNALARGQAAADIFTYTMRDAAGASSSATLTIGITGTNDAPVAVDDVNSLTVTSLASQMQTTVVNWVDWTSATWDSNGATPDSAVGTIDIGGGQTIGVTYTGEIFFAQTSGGTNVYNLQNGTVPVGTYTSAYVANGPNASSDIIALNQASAKTLTFSQPVDDLFFAVVSLNGLQDMNNGYRFDQDFQIVSSGAGYFGTGAATRTALPDGRFELLSTFDPTPQLREFHGVVRVEGSIESLTWTSLTSETWNGFTIGTYGKAQTATVAGNVLANDTDVDNGDTRMVSAVNGQTIAGNSITQDLLSGARVKVNTDGTYLYDEDSAFGHLGQGQTTVDSFQYTVKDAYGATSTATARITVTGINDGPKAVADNATTNEDTAVSIAVLNNDTDVDVGDSKTLLSATGALHGTLGISGGNVVYTPHANYNGADSFSYTMKDAAGATSTATVNVGVNPVTDTYLLSNLIVNGSFEQMGSGGTSGGSTAITGWTVTGSDIDRGSPTLWQPADGSYSLDLNGFYQGGVKQTLATIAGVQYTVGFALSKNPGATDYATVQVSADGTTQSYTFNTANTVTDMKWSQQTFTFTAVDSSTELEFKSLYPTNNLPNPDRAEGPALDEVVVVSNKLIDNFTKGAGGDVLNLHDLLSSVSAPHDVTAFSGGFLRFLDSNGAAAGGDTLVQVDSNGGGDSFVTLATLTGQLLAQADSANYLL